MSKKRIESWVPVARLALRQLEIAKDGCVDRGFSTTISAFGAAVVTGRLRSAVAFFSQRGNATVDRRKLIEAIYFCIFGEKVQAENVLKYVCNNETPDLKDMFVDASIAIKLAMNFFNLVGKEGQNEQS